VLAGHGIAGERAEEAVGARAREPDETEGLHRGERLPIGERAPDEQEDQKTQAQSPPQQGQSRQTAARQTPSQRPTTSPSQRAPFSIAARGASCTTPTTRSAIVVFASSARQASSARLNARWMPHGVLYSRAGTAAGPRRRISVQRNAGSSPSIAST